MPGVALAHALRAAHRREAARVVVVAGAGVAFLIAGPFWVAPICFATATVMYWRLGDHSKPATHDRLKTGH